MSERLFLQLGDDPQAGPETSAPPGTLRTFAAGAALRDRVANILFYREVFAPGQEVCERVVPDGAVRLAFNLGDPPVVGDGDGFAAQVIGATCAPVLVRLRRRMEGFSVTLRPGAAAALLGLPAGEIAGSAVSLSEVWGRAGAELLDRLRETHGDEARANLLRAQLQRRLRSDANVQSSAACASAARLIAASGGRRPLRDVAAAIGVGERRLQQLFHIHVGLSPRSWGRLARLHACLRGLRGDAAPDWADVALRSGFYDQSHLVNEFRALCGVTPAEYQGRVVSGSSNTQA